MWVIWAFAALIIWVHCPKKSVSGLTCLDLSMTDKWLVIDEAIPLLDYLIIEGGLHAASNASLHFTLNVNYIIISGRLAIGWENEPFNGTARIILRGQHSTPAVPHSDGPELGSKFIGKLTIFSQFFQFGSVFRVQNNEVKFSFCCTSITVVTISNMHAYLQLHSLSFSSREPGRLCYFVRVNQKSTE